MKENSSNKIIRWLDDLGSDDVPTVGGKNASLGEMIRALKKEGIRVPDGFATTSEAYRDFLRANDLEQKIMDRLDDLHRDKQPLEKIGKSIRRLFGRAQFPPKTAQAVEDAYTRLADRYDDPEVDVAVRSSATAEDLPEASFAGQQETFLNVTGGDELLEACRKCYASLFTDRAISYREEKGFDHMKVALSVCVQKMVRSDKGGSGVMFTLDTDTGFRDVVVINAAWGLGENVVQGTVTPDEYIVFKPLLAEGNFEPIIGKTLGDKEKKMIYARGGSRTTRNIDAPKKERRAFVLSDGEILQLSRWGCTIEDYYGKPMDIEWAKDGQSSALFIVQARPETVQSQKQTGRMKRYALKEKGERITTGLAIGDGISAGRACLIKSVDDIGQFKEDTILVTEMTDPDWVPIMKKARGIITDYGGRTSHAAIVSRELGIAAVVGCGDATESLKNDQKITISCAEGDRGYVYEGILDFETTEIRLEDLSETKTEIMMNMASPAAAFRWWRLPVKGIGLARMEFIINDTIKIHPLALVHYDRLEDKAVKKKIREMTRGYEDKQDYFVDHLARGLGKIAASQYPRPVIVRMSDFKTNEYADLIGGRPFEPEENNPMLGFRGAARYYSDSYRHGFALECRAIKWVRETLGLTNVVVMIPFCRTPEEADRVYEVMAENGLIRGQTGLEVYVMAEVPSNIILADQFAQRFDGFSIGSNDLTQLVLGVDRDTSEIVHLFDERNAAVKEQIRQLIAAAHQTGKKVGICGQAPSDYPEFAAFLIQEGIDSISLNPDSVAATLKRVAEEEQRLELNAGQ
ncbi:MAG: phosphoenolpyruvate synthase [Desulfobacterales bacterium]|jgi:pyruvate,water dikinase